MKRLFNSITTLEPTRGIGFVLFIIAWSRGDVSGLLAWAIMLLFIGFTIDMKKLR